MIKLIAFQASNILFIIFVILWRNF